MQDGVPARRLVLEEDTIEPGALEREVSLGQPCLCGGDDLLPVPHLEIEVLRLDRFEHRGHRFARDESQRRRPLRVGRQHDRQLQLAERIETRKLKQDAIVRFLPGRVVLPEDTGIRQHRHAVGRRRVGDFRYQRTHVALPARIALGLRDQRRRMDAHADDMQVQLLAIGGVGEVNVIEATAIQQRIDVLGKPVAQVGQRRRPIEIAADQRRRLVHPIRQRPQQARQETVVLVQLRDLVRRQLFLQRQHM